MAGLVCAQLRRVACRAQPLRLVAQARSYTDRYKHWVEKQENLQHIPGREPLRPRRHGPGNVDPLDPTWSQEQRACAADLRDLGLQRRWEEALARFRQIAEPHRFLHTAAVVACTRSSEPAWARRLLDEMPVKTLDAYTAVLSLLGRMGHIRDSEALLGQMESEGIEPDAFTFRAVIAAYGTAHDPEGAIGVLRGMEARGMLLGAADYSSALAACGKSGARDHAAGLIAEMGARGLEMDIGHFTSFIVSHARSKDEDGARQALAELRGRGLRPDIVTYTAFISCFAGRGSVQKGDAVLAELVQEGLAPHVYFYGELLRLATESEDSQRFREILEEMESRGIGHTGNTKSRIREHQYAARTWARAQPQLDGAPQAQPPQPASNLPDGWCEAVDPASGRPYYWQAADPMNTTTWERPSAA